jgi:hypothetical protein
MASLYSDFPEMVGFCGVMDMSTAIIGNYSDEVFVVASDGLSVWPDSSPKATNVRKIFEIIRPEIVLVYAVMGNPLITEDASGAKVVNIPETISENGLALNLGEVNTLSEFAKAACNPVTTLLSQALSTGMIKDYPPGESIATILFLGFFKNTASMVNVRVFHVNQVLQPLRVAADSLHERYHFGCSQIASLVDGGDKHFSRYAVPYKDSFTVDGRIAEAKGYIDAYGDEKARDPKFNCRGIGGETQICIVGRDNIEWVYGPATGGVE